MPNDTDTIDTLDHVKSLHTAAIDARNGYQEALKDAEGQGMSPLFADMIALHTKNADELATSLRQSGEIPDDGGSFMSSVHRAVITVRSLFGGLGSSVLPGLIDGEKRNVGYYDDALKSAALPASIRALITQQRDRLQAAILTMRSLER